jgi:hypothetical protein
MMLQLEKKKPTHTAEAVIGISGPASGRWEMSMSRGDKVWLDGLASSCHAWTPSLQEWKVSAGESSVLIRGVASASIKVKIMRILELKELEAVVLRER